jgi:2-oxoisovalerate dehydrogenase E1 component
MLNEDHGIKVKVIDLRWLAPLPENAILEAVDGCNGILIVDECRRSGSPSEALMALFVENGSANVSRVTAEDSFIATGPSFAATLPSRDGIVEAAIRLTKDRSPLQATRRA